MKKEKNNLPELPRFWAWTTLEQVTDYVENVNPRTKPDKEFIYLDISSIDNSLQKVTNTKKYFGKDAPSRARQLVKSGDILFSTVRTYLKKIAVVNEMYNDQIASTGFCIIRPIPQIQNKFIFWLVQTNSFLNPLNKLQRGTSYPAVRDSDVFSQAIPLPPFSEQHRIVAKIEELFTRLDAGVEALKKIKTQIKRYRQSVLKHAFEGKLTAEWREAHNDELEPASVLLERIKEERKKALGKKYKEYPPVDTTDLPTLPDGWVWTTLDNLFLNPKQEIVDGPFGSNLKAAEYMESGVPIIRLQNIDRNSFIDKNIKYINNKKAEELMRHNFLSGDIILTKLGVPLGKACIVPMTYRFGIIVADIVRLRIKHEFILREYIVYCINADIVAKQLEIKIKGTTRPRVNLGHIRELDMPLPPSAEQVQIVSEIERRFSVADEIEKVIDQSLKQADRLRQSILKRAFEGKLVPQDPSDEPAEKLLERIKAEKEQMDTTIKQIRKRKKLL